MAHLANTYGWSESCMMDMSLSRLLLYYTASFDLPYIIKTYEEDTSNNTSVIKEGNKTVTKRKEGLWEVTETIIDN